MADEFDFDATLAADQVAQLRGGLDGLNISADRFSRTLTRAFANAAISGKSLDATIRSVGMSLSNMALRAGLQPLQQGFGSLIGSLFSSVMGAPQLSSIAAPFADGGIVARPVFFGSGGGLGLMGERGAEAIMPLARGPDGRLGLAFAQNASRPVSVQVNISTPDAHSFQRSQSQVSAAIARAAMRGQRRL